jgi:hypothetical protein
VITAGIILYLHASIRYFSAFYVSFDGLQALVDKLKSIDNDMTVVTTRQGFLYLQVAASGIQLASEVQNLELMPIHQRSDRDMAQ